jgi:hypothetical protein
VQSGHADVPELAIATVPVVGYNGNRMTRPRARLALLLLALAGCAPAEARPPDRPPPPASAGRDGPHDFDFELGTWRTHLRRLVKPLSGKASWVEYAGTTVVRPAVHGRANLVELDVEGPAGHIEALSLRLYDPKARQWSLHFSNAASGTLAEPMYGRFRDGRGVFYGQDTVDGRWILVRFVISPVSATSIRFEQAFSDDGGATWEPNWIATDTR